MKVLSYSSPHLGSRYISRRCAEPSSETKTPIPGGIYQESIHWANVYHARPTNEVSRTRRLCCPPLIPTAPRRKNVRKKLNAMALEFSGKNVLIVDGQSCLYHFMFPRNS